MYYVMGEYADEKLAFMLASILLIGGVKKDPDTNKWMSYFCEQCPVRHVNFKLHCDYIGNSPSLILFSTLSCGKFQIGYLR